MESQITTERISELNEIVQGAELERLQKQALDLAQDCGESVEVINGELFLIREIDNCWLETKKQELEHFDDGEEDGYSLYFRCFTPPKEEDRDERHYILGDLYRAGEYVKRVEPNMEGEDAKAKTSIGEWRAEGDEFQSNKNDKKTGLKVMVRYSKSGIYINKEFKAWLDESLRPWFMDADRNARGFARIKFLLSCFPKQQPQ